MQSIKTKLISAGVLASALLVGGHLVGASSTAVAKELVFASWPPAVSHFNRVTLKNVFKALDEETKGAIKWKLVPGGQLAGPKESFQAASDGLVQGAFGISTYVPNLVPSLNTIYSTIVFTGDVTIATAAAMETFQLECPSCIAEFNKINITPISGWTSSQYYLACREPYKSVEDLKGKRIRATGGYSELWRLAGAVPVAATLPEAVTLLQRGGLDCENGVHNWLKVFGYGDFAKFVTNQPVGLTGPAIGMMINREVWKGMTREQQLDHLKQSAYICAAQALGDFTADNAKNLKFVMETKGVKLIAPEKKGFEELTAKFDVEQRKRNIANAKKFGVPDPGAIIDTYKKNLKKWTELTKDIPRDRSGIGKLTDLIWTHIYSKVDPGKI
jgi:TRAP-type C4-dicarboxylate transport system substrate-binding protein